MNASAQDRSATANMLGALGVLAAAACVPVYLAYDNWMAEKAARAFGAVEGPACPVVRKSARPPFGAKGPKTFHYGGIAFSRRYGHADCVAPVEGPPWDRRFYRVCQFSAPMTVRVTTADGRWMFQSGVGRPATVTVRGGEVRCVVGGWFRG